MEVSGQLQALAALSPGRTPGTHGLEGWVGPKGGLDDLEKKKISCPCRDRPVRTVVSIQTMPHHSCQIANKGWSTRS